MVLDISAADLQNETVHAGSPLLFILFCMSCLAVCLVAASSLKTKKHRNTKIGVNVI